MQGPGKGRRAKPASLPDAGNAGFLKNAPGMVETALRGGKRPLLAPAFPVPGYTGKVAPPRMGLFGVNKNS